MVDEQMYEQPLMPYDPYYMSYPNQTHYPNMYEYYMPAYPWGIYPNYPLVPYSIYPPYVPVEEASVPSQAAPMQEGGVAREAIDSKVLQQFMNDNGQVDIQKMLQTVGQFADTVQQVSPVIKQLNELVRSFRA